MHIQPSRRLRNIMTAQFINPLNMFPADPVSRHRVFRRFGHAFAAIHQRADDVLGGAGRGIGTGRRDRHGVRRFGGEQQFLKILAAGDGGRHQLVRAAASAGLDRADLYRDRTAADRRTQRQEPPALQIADLLRLPPLLPLLDESPVNS